MASLLATYSKEIISVVTPLGMWLINRLTQPGAKLVRSTRHAFTFMVQEPLRSENGDIVRPTQTIETASVSVVNVGRLPAKNVEIVFNWKPQFLNIWPIRAYTERESEDHRYSILLDTMAPKEEFGIELLSINRPLPAMVNVRCEQCTAIERDLMLQPVLPTWKLVSVGWLMLAGLIASIYLVLTLLQFAIA